MEAQNRTESPLKRRVTRRAVVGGTLAAGSVAVAYAALGDKLNLLAGSGADLGDAGAIRKESVKISHLLRRTAFGVTREEHDRYQVMGLAATIDELVNFSSMNDTAAVEAAAQVPVDYRNRANLPVHWLVRMANTKRPLQEKMTLFWHGTLTSELRSVRDSDAMLAQNEFLRTHAMDAFPTILKGITMDRAMMVYLDMSGSQRRAPNENYARELMELFSLGVGNYTEPDIREAARAFTGWRVPRTPGPNNQPILGEPELLPQQFDNGSKTVLGKTGNFLPDDIVDIIVQEPASHAFIIRKLFSWFIYPDPSDKEVQPFVDVFLLNDQRIGPVVEAMLRSDVFYSPKAYRSMIKSPVEYIVGAVKALGLQGTMAAYVPQYRQVMQAMGQVLFEPPNVSGWPSGEAWLNSTTIFGRLNFLNSLVYGGVPMPVRQPPKALDWAGIDLGAAEDAIAYFCSILLDDNISATSRPVLSEYAGASTSELTPERLRGLAYLILASPQFHLS